MLKFGKSFDGKPKASAVSPRNRLRLAVKQKADVRAQSESTCSECTVGEDTCPLGNGLNFPVHKLSCGIWSWGRPENSAPVQHSQTNTPPSLRLRP